MRRVATRIAFFVTLLLGIAGISPALGQAADATVTPSDFCNAWSQNTTNPEVTLASGYKITGSKLVRSGADCNADNAEISIPDSTIAELGTSSGGNAASRMLAAVVQTAVSTNDVKVGDEVFKGAVIKSLTATLSGDLTYVAISGGVEINWSGGTVTKLQFRGKFYAVDRYSLSLFSPAGGTVLPNVGGVPIDFTGSLVHNPSAYILDLTGTASALTLGTGDQQVSLSGASLKVTFVDEKTGTGLKVHATGGVSLGSTVKLGNTSIDAVFDSTGLLSFQGGGALDVTIPASGSSPAGSVTGNAQIAYQRDGAQSVTFTGDVRFGEALIAGASGTLDAQSVTFTGNVTLANADLTVKGGVDGIAYYGDNLAGRTIANKNGDQVQAQKGDGLIKSANATVTAKGLTVTGSAQVGNVGGQQWSDASGHVDLTFSAPGQPDTTITGSAALSWVKGSAPSVSFKGSVASGSIAAANVEGTVDGNKLAFKGDGSLTNPDLSVKGAVDGVVYYGDGSGDQLENKSGTKVDAKKGDFVLKSASAQISTKGFELAGAAQVARVGGDRWASGGGDVDLTLGDTNLKGHADMTWSAGEIPAVQFAGSIKAGHYAVSNVTGSVDGNQLSLKGDGTLDENGLSIKGAVDGTLFYGNDLSGKTIDDGTGKQVPAHKGDYIVKSLAGDVLVKGISLGGGVSLGSVNGVQWAKAGGNIDVTSGDTHIVGSADLGWSEGDSPVVNFTGSLTSGTTTVANATGTIDGKKIAIKGDAAFTANGISAKGAIDGVAYYGDPAGDTLPNADGTQVAAQKGDYLLKSGSGQVSVKNLDVSGNVALGKVAGSSYASGGGSVDLTSGATSLKGTAGFTWAQGSAPTATFAGSVASGATAIANAQGTLDGKKLTLKGDATVKQPTFTVTGAIDGLVYYGDPAGDTIEGPTGAQVAAKKGDYLVKSASGKLEAKGLTLSGNVTAGSAAGSAYAKGGGTVDTTFGTPATTIKGSATFSWDGTGAGSLSFDGTVTSGATAITGKGDLDGKKIALTGTVSYSTADLTITGGVDGTVYYGDPAGDTLPNASGQQVAAEKGDYVVKSASASVTVKNLNLTGKVSLGKVAGTQYASGGGAVDVTVGDTNVKGSADLAWSTGNSPVVNFSGSVTSGTTTVANASGTIDGKKIAIKGDASFTASGVSAKGAIDGVLYYGDPAGDKLPAADGTQVAAKKGDYLLKSASGKVTVKNLDVSGNLSLGKVAGSQYASGGGSVDLTSGATSLKGTAGFTWADGAAATATFAGSVTNGTTSIANASGSLDGKLLSLKGDATINESSFTATGAIDGSVYYADPAGGTIQGPSGSQVAASKGDFFVKSASGKVVAKGLTVTGALSAGSAGGTKWAKGGGSVDLTLGEVNLKGSANVSWTQGAAAAVDFTGSLTQGTTAVANVAGSVDGSKLTFKGDGTLSVNGLLVKGAVDGTLFYGSDLSGQTIADGSGKQVQASKGDYILKTASGDVTVKGLALGGNVSLGSVGGVQWVKAGGNVDVTVGDTHIVGSADLGWNEGDSPAVNFTGSLTSGTTTVANATGTIDGKKIAIKGSASFTNADLTLAGSVDGIAYYGDPAGDTLPNADGTQVAAQKGDYLLKSATGKVTVKGLDLTGDVSLGKVAGSSYAKGGGTVDLTSGATSLKGSAGFTWAQGGAATVTFSGSVASGNAAVANVSGTIDGKKLTFKGDGTVKEAAFTASGAVEGLVYYGDPAGDKIEGPTGAQVAAKKGDYLIKTASGKLETKGLTLSGNISAGTVGGIKWAKGGGSIDTTFGNPATTIKGSATFSWAVSGAGTLSFDGTVTSGATVLTGKGTLDGKKIALSGSVSYSSADLSITGAVDGTVYYGDPAGDTLPNAAGTQVAAQKGDYVVTGASGSVTVKNLALSGNVSLGKVAGSQYASGGGSVDITSGVTNLKGSATFSWATGQTPAVAFSGSVTSGTTTVANVTGSIDGKKIALKGSVSVTETNYSLSGGIDGVFYYGDPAGDTITGAIGNQVAAKKGDYYLKSASGSLTSKGITLSGEVSAGSAGGIKWAKGGGSVNLTFGSPATTIKGTASFTAAANTASLSFSGSVTQGDNVITASGTLDGKKLVFTGSLASPTLSGNATGGVYYGTDLSGETIVNRSGATVAASRGDFYLTVTNGKAVLKQLTATANFTLKKVGSVTWASTDAQIQVGTTWLTFSGEMDSTGVINLKGAGQVTIDGYKVDFNGTALVQNNAVTLSGTVVVTTGLFQVALAGTFNKPDMNSTTYSFVGSGAFKFGGIQVAGATIRFITGEGITTSFKVQSCVLFVCTTGTYKLYFTGGDISKIQLSAPILSWPAFFAIAKITAPNIPVETTITGIL